MTDFPLQPLVEAHDCKYFAENDTGDGAVLNLALRSPFTRLYALNRSPQTVEAQKHRFANNERIQLFRWTHDGAWEEVVKLIPIEQPAVFWMHPSEHVSRGLAAIGRLRPLRKDVIIFETGILRGAASAAELYFSRTHRFGFVGLAPNVSYVLAPFR